MHEPGPDHLARLATRRRWKCLGVLSVTALLLHAAAISGLDWAWPRAEPVLLPAATTFQVRVVDAPRVPAEPAMATPAAVAAVPEPPAMTAVRTKPAPAAPAARPVRAAAIEPAGEPVPASAAPQLALSSAAIVAAPAAVAEVGDEAIPHYRTRMPPAATLRYEMQRGPLRGTGDLSWKPQGDHYELRLEARVSGLPVLTQASAGAFDAAGVAPVRFTDQRLRRGTVAANFQRGAGKITFSGPATEFALRDGAQDRLSWMIQLAAIVNAEPQLATTGAKVVMYVVGAHGDAGIWVFRCVGPEAVQTRGGTVDSIKFVREPREAYDTTVQVWLDPRRHDLPVRATQNSGAGDEGFELRLLELIPTS